jgi:hypothetical protein
MKNYLPNDDPAMRRRAKSLLVLSVQIEWVRPRQSFSIMERIFAGPLP